MTTTDIDALTERLREVIAEARDKGERTAHDVDSYEVVAAVLPIVTEEVRKAKAEAWQEGVNFALPGKETYWISKHNPHRATESGDSDEHR